MIPRLRPDIGPLDLRRPPGDLEERIEAELREITGAAHVVLVPYGRTAIHLFCEELLGGRGHVLMPAFSCVSVANAIAGAGAVPRFVDVDPADANTSPDRLEAEARKGGAGMILCTHLFGSTADVEAHEEIRARAGIRYLVIDAALALFSYHRGRHVASFGDAAILSFNLGKHVSFLQGGAFVTSDPALHARFRAAVRRSIARPPAIAAARKWLFYLSILATYQGGLYPVAHHLYHRTRLLDFLSRGVKSGQAALPEDLLVGLTPLQLALGEAQLARRAESGARRRRLQDEYHRHLAARSVTNASFATNLLSHYPVRVPDRERLFALGHERGIYLDGGLFEYALPSLPQFRGAAPGTFPGAETLAREIVNLPLYPGLREQEQRAVIDLVLEHLGRVGAPEPGI